MMKRPSTKLAPRTRAVALLGALTCLATCQTSMSAARDGHVDGVTIETSSPESGVDGPATACPSEAAGTRHAAPCPSSCPAASSACATNGARCEYGDDPRGPFCRDTALCLNGLWTTIGPTTSLCEALTPAAGVVPRPRRRPARLAPSSTRRARFRPKARLACARRVRGSVEPSSGPAPRARRAGNASRTPPGSTRDARPCCPPSARRARLTSPATTCAVPAVYGAARAVFGSEPTAVSAPYEPTIGVITGCVHRVLDMQGRWRERVQA